MPEQETNVIPKQPEFNGGAFTIEYLSPSSEGFTIRTHNSLRRHEPNTPLPESKRIKSQKEPKHLRVGPEFAPKIGIRSTVQNGNELMVDILPVTHPTYRAISSPKESPTSLEIANPTATAAALITTEPDGSHNLIVQHRSERNFFYGDVPGASIAGFLDGKLDTTREGRGKLLPIDTQFVKGNIIKEMSEEIGLVEEDLNEVRITGIAKDLVRIHNEILFLTVSNLSSQQISQKAQELQRTKNPEDPYDFAEKFFVIQASPEAIEKLLTEVKCPIPSTHTAVFVAAGYSVVIEEKGTEEANRWKTNLEEGIKRNYQEMDEIVALYYREHPEALDDVVENKPPRNTNGYEPAYLPQQQGLPGLISELKRTGLLLGDDGNEEEIQPETGKTTEHVWLFDVDGVVTDPNEKRVTEPEILDEIVKRLEKGEPVMLISGRSMEWLDKQVVTLLEEKVADRQTLDNLFVSSEFGGMQLEYKGGQRVMSPDPEMTLPKDIERQAKEKARKPNYAGAMFIDETKRTMVSVEMHKNFGVNRFKPFQKELAQEFQDLLNINHLDQEFEVHEDTIATNLKHKEANKKHATRQALNWLGKKGVKPKAATAFGDNKTDLEMAEEANKDIPTKLIFVGERKLIAGLDLPYAVTYPEQPYTEGTSSYLASIS